MVHHGRDATGETSQDTAELNLEKESGILRVRGSPGVRWPWVETQQAREDQQEMVLQGNMQLALLGTSFYRMETILHALCSKIQRKPIYPYPFNGNSAFIKLK